MSRQGTIVEPAVDGQIMFNGFALGKDTPYSWIELNGWDDMPGIDSGNRPRPGQHGSWAGTKYYQERIITLSGRIEGAVAEYAGLVAALRRATALPEDDAEFPFVVRKDGISEAMRTGIPQPALLGQNSSMKSVMGGQPAPTIHIEHYQEAESGNARRTSEELYMLITARGGGIG